MAVDEPFLHTIETIGGVTVVRCDYPHLALECRDTLYGLVETQGVRRLVLDLGQVRSVASVALGVLVSLNRKMSQAGGQIRFCGLDPNVQYLFQITTLDRILDIEPDLPAALASLDRPA